MDDGRDRGNRGLPRAREGRGTPWSPNRPKRQRLGQPGSGHQSHPYLRYLRIAVGAALVATVAGPVLSPAPAHSQAPPRLTVVVVVDQMPVHLLERFDDLYVGGLRRLLDEGAVFTRARHRHGIPHTGPGHATLATGSDPSAHGIVSNNWLDRATGTWTYAAGDSAHPIVGGAGDGRSPRLLERSALGTHLKRAHPGARVIAISPKDRSAILTAGHDADGAYWFDAGTGRWITSAWYRPELPDWVTAFNASGRADALARREWTPLHDDRVYLRSRADDAPYENAGEDTTFPHAAPAAREGSGWAPGFAATPWLDELTLDLARAAIDAEDLGGDATPDLLWIGLSAGDYIGHSFGPWSREVQDAMLRLDRALGEFLSDLDGRLGSEGYVVALSADHGVVPMPEWAHAEGLDARRVDRESLTALIRPALDRAAAAEGVTEPVPATLAYKGVYLRLPRSLAADAAGRVTAAVAQALRAHPRVADAFTDAELAAGTSRPFAEAFRRSRFAGRSPDIFLLGREHDLIAGRPAITAHLSPYDHDVRVPLIIVGAAVRRGRFGRDVATVDLAPTLARLLGISEGDFDGAALEEALG